MSKDWTRDSEEYTFRNPLESVMREQEEIMKSSNNGNYNPPRQNNQQRFDDNRNRQNNQNRYPYDNRNNRNDYDNRNDNRNNNQQNNNNRNERNPFLELIGNDGRVYSNKKDDIYKMLVGDKGLNILIKDLKAAKKDPNVNVKYIQTLIKDPVFASPFIEAMDAIVCKDGEQGVYSRKQIQLLITEIYSFVNSSFDKEMANKYDSDTLNTMRDAYRFILYRFNKKKVKKMLKQIKDMDENMAKDIAVIASGGNAKSVYHLIKFFYKNADNVDSFEASAKTFNLIFSIAYGCEDYEEDNDDKKRYNEIIKWIMLERALPAENKFTDNAKDVYVQIDKMVRKYLEKCSKSDIIYIIKGFVEDRRKQEDGKAIMPRRFNPKSIHSEDFPNIMRAVSKIEMEDLTTVPFLGKVNNNFYD